MCFLAQSPLESLAEAALSLSMLTPGLTVGYMSVWGRSGKNNRAGGRDTGWLLCLSISSRCSNRAPRGLQKLCVDFQCPCSLPDHYTGHSFNMKRQYLFTYVFFHFMLNALKPRSPAQEEPQVFHCCKPWASATSRAE